MQTRHAGFPIRISSSETATRCTAIQMLLAGVSRQLVCDTLLVSNRILRKWINFFNHSGVDGLIAKKRPGRMTIITHVCKNEEHLLECLDQAILDVIYNPSRTQKTAAIGALL